jgi:prepilin-type N-terminal cleavage/methylation domain-containing protein
MFPDLRKKINQEQGFSLVEVIVVIVLLSLMAVAVSTRFGNEARTRADFTVYKLRSDIRYAQLLAITTQSRVRVQFAQAANTYFIQQEQAGGAWADIQDPATRQPYRVILNAGNYAGVTLFNVNFNGTPTLVFDGRYDPALNLNAMGSPEAGGQVVLNGIGAAGETLSVQAVTGQVTQL